jgi:alpha-1,3-fucosyltransferase
MAEKDYFFYASFENSLYHDYVTEKLTRAYNNFVVPIVYGGSNYSRFVPPHTYINVNDFETPKQLADYLRILVKNPALYVKYFWWKRYYKLSFPDQFCNLCIEVSKRKIRGRYAYYKKTSR